jgi:hypothetical protein
MGPEARYVFSQKKNTDFYAESSYYSPHAHNLFIILTLHSHYLLVCLPTDPFPSGIQIKLVSQTLSQNMRDMI